MISIVVYMTNKSKNNYFYINNIDNLCLNFIENVLTSIFYKKIKYFKI